MHILLTDLLACPRCGPAFGLILLAEEIEERRVLEGELGCPNCRDHYPIRSGFGDLRSSPRRSVAPSGPPLAIPGQGEVMKLAALIGVTGGPGRILLAGTTSAFAPGLAALIEGVGIVAMDPRTMAWEEEPGISRLASGPDLPFMDRKLRGVVFDAREVALPLAEAVRSTAPGSRIVLLHPDAVWRERLRGGPLPVILDAEGALVAERE